MDVSVPGVLALPVDTEEQRLTVWGVKSYTWRFPAWGVSALIPVGFKCRSIEEHWVVGERYPLINSRLRLAFARRRKP